MILNKLKIILLIILLVFASCCKEEESEPKPIPESNIILNLVNEVRAKGCNCGTEVMPAVDSIKWNSLLVLAAKGHSDDMNTNNYFSHIGLDGSTVADRINKTGFKWTCYGENIAYGATTEKQVFELWMNSPGHCKNIMNSKFGNMGVASSGLYWTQVFTN